MPSPQDRPYGLPSYPLRALAAASFVFGLACVAPGPRAQTSSTAPGLSTRAWRLPKAAKFWAQLVPMGDEIISYDGAQLRRFDARTGREGSPLANTGTPVFSSLLALGPTGTRLYIGESSNGTLRSYDLRTKSFRNIATLEGNYRLVWRPREGERFAYVSARPTATKLASVVRVDTVSGEKRTVAAVPGFSGPLAFDASGALYFAPASLRFGVPKLGVVLRWSARQVNSAVSTGTPLDATSATRFASGFDNAGDLAFDAEGTLYASDQFSKATSSILEFGGGARFARNVFRSNGRSLSALSFEHGSRPFERFGRASSKLWVLSSDFAGDDRVHCIETARPALAVDQAQPKPGAGVRFDASGLPASSFAIFLLGPGLQPEAPIGPFGVRGLMFPDFAVIPSAIAALVVTRSTSQGRASLAGLAPRASGLQWTTQVLAGPVTPLQGGAAVSPWVTSQAVVVRVQ